MRKSDVIVCHEEHPEWGAAQIAAQLGCSAAYVRATAYRNGIDLPSSYYVAKTPAQLRDRAVGLELWAERLREKAAELEAST